MWRGGEILWTNSADNKHPLGRSLKLLKNSKDMSLDLFISSERFEILIYIRGRSHKHTFEIRMKYSASFNKSAKFSASIHSPSSILPSKERVEDGK